MKNFILICVFMFSAQSFAAICSCDAAPSCGPRPASCFQQVARGFVGKIFVENRASNPTILSFAEKATYPNTVEVGWGRNTDGMPFGKFYVAFTSENTFSLFLAPFSGQRPSLVEEFEFNPNQIDSIRTQDGRIFLREK